MRVIVSVMLVALGSAVIAPQAVASHSAHEDNKLNYKSCDGKNFTARWDGFNFHSSVAGDARGVSDPVIQYLSWDGTCRTVRWDAKSGRFVHTLEGASRSDLLINYVSWDGSKWSATRAGGGFYHVYVAGKDEAAPDRRMKDAAAWLRRHKAESRVAGVLASELSEAAGD